MDIVQARKNIQSQVKVSISTLADNTITALLVVIAVTALWLAFFSHNRIMRIVVLAWWLAP